MKAARFHGPGDLRLEERPLPEPGANDVRVRPQAVGLCGTDAHILGGEFPADGPVVLGHEVAGVIDMVGRSVTSLSEGDVVSMEPHVYCGLCRYCRGGREHLCPKMRAFGVHLDGGLAEALVIPARNAYLLPRGLDVWIGCLAEPVACCVHGIDRLAPVSGLPLLAIGAGPAGLILLARLRGASPIVAVEPTPARRRAALAFGADQVLDPGADGWRERAVEIAGGHGFDAVIEAVGGAATFEAAVALAAPGGRVLVFGAAPIQSHYAHALAHVPRPRRPLHDRLSGDVAARPRPGLPCDFDPRLQVQLGDPRLRLPLRPAARRKNQARHRVRDYRCHPRESATALRP